MFAKLKDYCDNEYIYFNPSHVVDFYRHGKYTAIDTVNDNGDECIYVSEPIEEVDRKFREAMRSRK